MIFSYCELKISLFKLGLGLIVIGIIWISLIFHETEKVYDSVSLEQSNSFEISSEFIGKDIGYFKIHIPDFNGEQIFVQILDGNKNVIEEQRVQTKLSIGYFDFNKGDIFTTKIVNISKNPINIEIEFGNTNSQKMIPAGMMILIGSVIIIMISYMKLKNYNIEQPDENIS